MPSQVTCLLQDRLLHLHFSGKVSVTELSDVNLEMTQRLGNCAAREAVDILIDVNEMATFPPPATMAQTLAYMKHPACKTIVLISTNPKLSHAFQTAGQLRNVQIACTEQFDDAIAYLVAQDYSLFEQLQVYT